MARFGLVLTLALCLGLSLFPDTATARLSRNFYANSCPTVEEIVGKVVKQKINETFVTIPATLRLFFHDCFSNGCDASILIESTANNTAEKDSPDNQSLAGDGFDVVAKAKAAIDANSTCRNKVSCADILTIATRDVIVAAGGPFYEVELGRLDSLNSTAESVIGKLPEPTNKTNELIPLYAQKNLTIVDMVALSGAHTVGFAHCTKVFNRIYNFSNTSPVDPTLNKTYAEELQKACPKNIDPRVAINMDPETPSTFDNVYFKDLQQGRGLFTSDQDLFTNNKTRSTVNNWANNSDAFFEAFVTAMIKLGRIGIKTGTNGNIRHNCAVLN